MDDDVGKLFANRDAGGVGVGRDNDGHHLNAGGVQAAFRRRSGGVQAVVGTRRGESYRCIGDPEVPDSLNTEMGVAYCPLVLGASHPDGPKTRHEEAIRNTPGIGPGGGNTR